MKVVIVEDDLIVADHLKLILEEMKVTVLAIYDSAEVAIANLQTEADLYFVDVRLCGKMSGIDLGIKLTQQQIPFVYQTANNEKSTLEELQINLTTPLSFISKPYKEKDIIDTLKRFKKHRVKIN